MKTKKIIIISTLSLIIFSLNSCKIKSESEKLYNETIQSVENVQNEFKKLEKDITTATKEIKEASQAINNIGK